MEVRFEYLKPREIEEAMTACPTLFQPLGTIEWHGVHNVVGVDAIKAHQLCVLAAQKGGGIVAPPVYGGVGGLSEPHTFVMEPEESLYSQLLRPWVEKLCMEAERQGFKAMIILTGHYGAAQQIAVRELAVRMTRALGIPILGTPEYFLALDEKYYGDHAAWGETSLMMTLFPETVALDRLGEEPHQGVGGIDPKRFACKADGDRLSSTIVNRLASLAEQMPKWDQDTIDRFVNAESALVTRQLSLAGINEHVWTAWRNIGQGVFNDYGKLLVENRFEEIVALVEKL